MGIFSQEYCEDQVNDIYEASGTWWELDKGHQSQGRREFLVAGG